MNHNRNYLFCFLYGSICVILVCIFFGGVERDPIGTIFHGAFMGSREGALTHVIGKFSIGEFPNLTSSHDHSIALFLYEGVLGAFLNIHEGYRVMTFVQMLFICLCFLILPFEIYSVRKKLSDIICSFPLIVSTYGCFFFIYKTDVHWASIWCLTVSIPLLLKLVDENNFIVENLLVGVVSLYISISNIMRAHSGLYSLIALIGVVLYRLIVNWSENNRRQKLYLVICTFVMSMSCYNLFGDTIPNWICISHGQNPSNALSSYWHNFYIGFGTYKNVYGLYYSDDCARDIIMPLHPDIEYGGKEYFEICRELTLDLFKNDPLFCFKTLIKKFRDSVRIVMNYYFFEKNFRCVFNWIIVVLFLRYCYVKEINLQIRYISIMLAIVLFGTLQAVMASPAYIFLLWPAFGGVGICITIMGILIGDVIFRNCISNSLIVERLSIIRRFIERSKMGVLFE